MPLILWIIAGVVGYNEAVKRGVIKPIRMPRLRPMPPTARGPQVVSDGSDSMAPGILPMGPPAIPRGLVDRAELPPGMEQRGESLAARSEREIQRAEAAEVGPKRQGRPLFESFPADLPDIVDLPSQVHEVFSPIPDVMDTTGIPLETIAEAGRPFPGRAIAQARGSQAFSP